MYQIGLTGLIYLLVASGIFAPNDKRYSFSFTDKDAGQAIHEIAVKTGIDLVYDPAIIPDITLTIEIRDKQPREILHLVLDEISLGYYRLSNGVYVINTLPKIRINPAFIPRDYFPDVEILQPLP